MRKLASLLAVIAIFLTVLPAAAKSSDPTAQGDKMNRSNSIYCLQMSRAPVVTYQGRISPATCSALAAVGCWLVAGDLPFVGN